MGVKTLTLNMCNNDDDDDKEDAPLEKKKRMWKGNQSVSISQFMCKSLLRLLLCNMIYYGSLILYNHV